MHDLAWEVAERKKMGYTSHLSIPQVLLENVPVLVESCSKHETAKIASENELCPARAEWRFIWSF